MLQVKKFPLGNRRFFVVKVLTLAKRSPNNRSTLRVSKCTYVSRRLKRFIGGPDLYSGRPAGKRLLAMLRKFSTGGMLELSIVVAIAGPIWSVP